MAAPELVRVKLSTEAAESISLTPVVVRDMPFLELIEEIAAVRGKDANRIAETLKLGSVTGRSTRYRWPSVELTEAELAAVLALLPDDEPGRPFDLSRCTQAALTGPGVRIEVLREVAEARRMFHRTSFWSELHRIVAPVEYVAYSYRERADVFRAALTLDARNAVRAALPELKHAALARKISLARFDAIEFVVRR